ncbi:hypothetical protein [Streptomyces sp. MBT27]|uniref:hypothetical protein n=1 Tax=Streptomyces sp. MBT27 TaxID=1488356 RepID=UPI00142437D5|nr:hypothetical protein [Streptomyces sp. MBT27]
MRINRALTACLSTILMLAGLMVGAAPAGASAAGPLDLTCTPPSSQNTRYSPALTISPQTVTTTRNQQFGPCASLSHPLVTSGTSTLVTTGSRTCLDLLSSNSVTLPVTWNTGQTSTLSGNSVVNVVGAVNQTEVTGTVTSGLFAGDTFVMNVTGAATDILLCTAGLGTVSSLYDTITLEITSL